MDYHCRAQFKWIHGTEIGDDARLCGATLCAMECVSKVRSQRDLIVRYLELWRRASRSQKPFLALSSGAATTEVAAEQLTAGAGQQEGHVDTVVKSCQELEIYVFLTRVSEGTLGLVDYHCRAPFRPSVPWCFPVREVRLFKAIYWLKDVVSSCSSRSRSSAAATTKVAAEQLTAGAG